MQNNIVTIIRQLEDANASGNAEQAVRLLDIMNQLLQEDDGTVEMTYAFSDENKEEDVDDEKKEDNQYDDMPILISITDENESKDDLDHPVETDEEDDMPELISDIEMDDTMIVDIHVDGNQVLVYYR